MGNKYNYEYVLGEIACYIAKECNLTPSEAIGVVMNEDCTDAVIEEIQKSDRIDIASRIAHQLKHVCFSCCAESDFEKLHQIQCSLCDKMMPQSVSDCP